MENLKLDSTNTSSVSKKWSTPILTIIKKEEIQGNIFMGSDGGGTSTKS